MDFKADGRNGSIADLHVHLHTAADEDTAVEVPSGRYSGCDAKCAVIVLHQRFGKCGGDDAGLFDVELAVLIAGAQMGESVDEVLAGFGDLEKR